MQIRNLENIPVAVLVDAIGKAFEGYFVPMPTDVPYWEMRFKGARVNWNLSFGVFENEQLVGFIIHGIDLHNGLKTAFNTGTGVIPAFRNRQLVSRMYEHALPLLRENGIQKCMLEVITANDKAIRIYEKNGFRIVRKLNCFRGTLTATPDNVKLDKISLETIRQTNSRFTKWYSWDHSNEALEKISTMYDAYTVSRIGAETSGYFIINPQSGYLPQMELTEKETAAGYDLLLGGISLLRNNVRINNVDTGRTLLREALLRNGLENHIDQFEMEHLP